MEGGFNHTEQSYYRLTNRLGSIQEHMRNPLSEERLNQLRQEAACITFELIMRESHIGLHNDADLEPADE
jgi:hypothetical protein